MSTAALREALDACPNGRSPGLAASRSEASLVLTIDAEDAATLRVRVSVIFDGQPRVVRDDTPDHSLGMTGPVAHPQTGLLLLEVPGVLSAVFETDAPTTGETRLRYAASPVLHALGIRGGRYELTGGQLTVRSLSETGA